MNAALLMWEPEAIPAGPFDSHEGTKPSFAGCPVTEAHDSVVSS